MLQQTQVKTVIPYFNNFVKKIPNLKTLSKCKEKQVLKLWEGLGYYRRAKNLHKASKILVKNYKSKVPNTFEEIKKLPGVGEYTANILLALIYNQPRIGIDGNVKRIFLRLFKKNVNNFDSLSNKTLYKSYNNFRYADMAEALMEFGAIICKPKNPLCNICTLKQKCHFYRSGNFNLISKKILVKEKNFNVFCYIKKQKKQIALTKNKNFSFLNNFNIPKTEIVNSHNNKKRISGWIHLCNYKNSISNIKMNINLFYKYTKAIPKSYKWYSIKNPGNEFIPTFTKKIIKRINIVT